MNPKLVFDRTEHPLPRAPYFRVYDTAKGAMYGPFRIDMYFRPNQLGYKSAVDKEGFEFSDNLIWMQKTGISDSRGTDVYEGDIIRSKGFKRTDVDKDTGENIENVYYIYYEAKWITGDRYPHFDLVQTRPNGWYLFDFAGTITKGRTDLEVVGNRYENPELLDAKDFIDIMPQ